MSGQTQIQLTAISSQYYYASHGIESYTQIVNKISRGVKAYLNSLSNYPYGSNIESIDDHGITAFTLHCTSDQVIQYITVISRCPSSIISRKFYVNASYQAFFELTPTN